MSKLAHTILLVTSIALAACSSGENGQSDQNGQSNESDNPAPAAATNSGGSGGGMSGTYSNDEVKLEYEFTPERVYVTSPLGGTSATLYTVDGNRVLVGMEGQQQVLTIIDEYSLKGPLEMTFTKERASIKAGADTPASNSNSPASAAEAYMSAIASQNFKAALSHVNGGAKMLEMPSEQFAEIEAEMKAGLEAQGGITDFQVTDEMVKGDEALVAMETSFGNGSQETGEMRFIRINGRWLLN